MGIYFKMDNNKEMDQAFTGVMNSMGQDGNFKATNLPIKNRVNALDRTTKEAGKMLNDNKKEVQLLRSECATLEHHATETTNDILKEVIEDIANLEKDYLKLQASDIDQINFLKAEIAVLNQEKIALQQNSVALDSRITVCEQDIGYE